ncbi:DEAD/DEAH box helicase [Streptomyces cinereoruber]|uniref:DEAD/DEAH box helicase n=2 Tax=Streptomyces cinereoruber TaxID=67260 RepID=A0AAV4KHF9_9ACTN|nr:MULTISPECIES: DEAD/DEAH box helicase [Streptomyces]AVH97978.1 ATP-dependent helicase [Streptomyces sp. WAC00288]KYG56568.1 DEAD/DEAH box helicase [Streptomyces sp. WAC04657]MBB4155779.1 superfamily II DNA/RNA helicase [Streptomyces cinereoruber]MBY8817103.1 DEAD/DEAH box helicase [Streptomyces cinereoruber]NIH64590.1 superfamily II DNA/RNA helicase [Streptomyces cinereoruber]
MTRSERPHKRGPRTAQAKSTSQPKASRGGRRPAAPPPPSEFTPPVSVTPALPPVASFADLDMPEGLLRTLGEQGVTEPFPIQAATLPNSLAGRDVLGRGRTGSGKTLAFGLALLARTAGRRAEPTAPLALVLVPTRELAQQVTDALTPYAGALRLRITTVVGGMSITRQSSSLRRGAEVLIATPGRLADLIDRGDCRLDQVAVTVLDEADQMADMGFLPQVTKLLKQVEPGGQRLLFSATLDRNIDRLVKMFLDDPVVHSVDPSAGAVTTMEHHVLYVADETDKKAVTLRIAARDGRTILFLDTKRSVDRLVKRLLANGVRASGLHGGRSQPQRNRTLDQFKNGQVTTLVATNVAARGIHVDDLDMVVNVDPPMDHKDYLHRGGRTARAGESGSVFTLVLPDQKRDMGRLMSNAGISPRTAQIKSSDEELAELTGAREPSGVPVVIETPQPTPPRKPAGSGAGAGNGGGRRRRRPAGSAPVGASTGSTRGSASGTGTGGGRGSGTGGGRAAGTGRGAGTGRAAASTSASASAGGGRGGRRTAGTGRPRAPRQRPADNT